MAFAKKSPGTSTTPGEETLGFVFNKELHHQSLEFLAWPCVLCQNKALSRTALLQLLVIPDNSNDDNPAHGNGGL